MLGIVQAALWLKALSGWTAREMKYSIRIDFMFILKYEIAKYKANNADFSSAFIIELPTRRRRRERNASDSDEIFMYQHVG